MDKINSEIYRKCGLTISDFITEPESKEYCACQFQVNGQLAISRTAKITPKKVGQFVVFPKSILITKEIVITEKKDGKRGFRVYPVWTTPTNKQAEKTQQWQLDYFYEIGESTDFEKVKKLYNTNN